jgi:hypothetical protein
VVGDPPPLFCGRLLAVRRSATTEEGDVRVTTAFNRMLGLPGAWVRDVEFGERAVIVTVALRRKQPICSGCGVRGLPLKDLWRLTWKWAMISHEHKPAHWVFARYFAKFNKARQDRWVFGNRQTGGYLHRFAWTNIVRHQIVRYGASPDDPELADYWAWRRRKAPVPINRTALWLHREQDGRCAICRVSLIAVEDRPQTPHQWETWLATTRKTIDVVWDNGTSDKAEPRLIHPHCNPTHQPLGLA